MRSSATLRIVASLVVIGVAGAACAQLPSIAENQCGNRIVDATEDCDTFAPNGSTCIVAGNENECRFDCSGSNACPPTYACGAVDKICRRATGKYDVANVTTLFAAANVMAIADFDGDGRADALTSGVNDVRVHYFDGRLSLSKTLILPIPGPRFHVGSMGSDTNSDLEIFRTTGLIDVFQGESDRTLSPVVYSSVPIPNTSVTARAFLARNQLGNTSGDPAARPTGDDIFAFGSGEKGVGAVLDLAGRAFTANATVPSNQIVALPDSTVDKLAGRVAVGGYIEGSVCDQFAIGFMGASNVAVYTPCRTPTNPPTTPFAYEINAVDAHYVPPTRVQMPAGATFGASMNGVDAGAFSVDANEDGHLDLVIVGSVSAVPQIYIAYGVGNGTFSSSPTLTPVDDTASHFATADNLIANIVAAKRAAVPLAVGDLNHDKVIDLVFPSQIEISETNQPLADGGAMAPHYLLGAADTTTTTWSSAVIADLNGDGISDVAATNPTGSIDYFMGTGTQAMSYLSYGLDGTPSNLVVGDFDGDLVNDLAYSVNGVVSDVDAGAASSELQAMFGQAHAFPAQPTTLGTTPSVLQLTAAPLAGTYTGATAPTNVNVSSMVTLTLDTSSNVFAAILVGNPARIITSAFALFAPDLQRAAAVRGVTGPFTTAGQSDMIVIARNADAANSHSFWYLPSSGAAAIDSTNLTVGPALPPSIDWESSNIIGGGLIDSAGVLQALVFATPPSGTTGQAQLFPVDAKALTLGTPITLPCNYQNTSSALNVQNRTVDFDGDGNRDLLVFCPDVSGKPVVVMLWGDVNGTFDGSRMTTLPVPSDPVTSITQVRNGPVVARSVLMLTANGVFVSSPSGSDSRTFTQPIQDPTLPGGSFFNSADMDGDGVLDLGIVDSSKTQVQFFRGIPINDSPSVP